MQQQLEIASSDINGSMADLIILVHCLDRHAHPSEHAQQPLPGMQLDLDAHVNVLFGLLVASQLCQLWDISMLLSHVCISIISYVLLASQICASRDNVPEVLALESRATFDRRGAKADALLACNQ